MSKATVEVSFTNRSKDGPDGQDRIAVEAGRQLSGTLIVAPREPLKVNEIYVQLRATAQGKGNTYTKKYERQHFPVSELSPMAPFSSQFAVTVPDDAPLSYRGYHLSVDWVFYVRVDIPWALDHKEEYPLLVVPKNSL